MVGNKYLDEKRYQKNKRKIIIVALLVLMIGLSIGGGLVATGLIKYNKLKLSVEETKNIQTEIDSYNTQLSSLKSQQNQEFINSGMSEEYYNLKNEIAKIDDKIDELEDKLNPDTSYLVIFYIFGGFIIIASFMISGSIYATAKGREISAFYAQQQIPVAKEGIDEIAPTLGNVAHEIAKGIKKN